MPPITWLLEPNVFPNGDCLVDGALAGGHRIINWSDLWWTDNLWPAIMGSCVFHGSLGNADRIQREKSWRPGSFCNTEAFCSSAWYPTAQPYLLHQKWEIIPAATFVATADAVFERLGGGKSLFVRPDSPLKPFSGRVVTRGKVTLAALDHGFYYEDEQLPIVVAPVQTIIREWRFVVVNREIVSGSSYLAVGRTASDYSADGEPWKFAVNVAKTIPQPDMVFVMDICETPDGLRLIELNPFSGADLYGCNGITIVNSIADAIKD